MVAQGTAETGVYVNGIYYPAGGFFYDGADTLGDLGPGGKYGERDIVVTGLRRHWDNSISYQLATYDPYNHEVTTWTQHASFLDMAKADADARVINFKLEAEGEFTAAELTAIEAIKAMVPVLIAALQKLDHGGYFHVEGWGNIPVGELISLLARADWEIYPDNHFDNGGVGQAARKMGNPEFRIERKALVEYASQVDHLIYYIVHETSHVTRAGDRARVEIGGGIRLETMTNDVARKITQQLGMPVNERPGYGYGATRVSYHPKPAI